jgi:hypothetical protein
MRVTKQQLAKMILKPNLKEMRGFRPSPKPHRMNKTELDYADILVRLQLTKQIVKFAYEPIKLRLAENTTYTPDFEVVRPDGSIEFHEVKGGFIREDAWLKLKIAAELFPEFTFYLCQYKNKTWSTKRV